MRLLMDIFSLKESRLLFFLMALNTQTSAQSSPPMLPKWTEFRDTVGRFRLLVPHPPSYKTQSVTTPVGTLTNHQFLIAQADTHNLTYTLSYCDYPTGTFPSDSMDLIRAFLDETIDNTRAALNGALNYAADAPLKQYVGKIWRIGFNDGQTFIKCKAFLVGDRFYLIHVVTPHDKLSNAAADKFLNSFSVF